MRSCSRGWEVLEREGEGRIFRLLGGHGPDVVESLFQQILRRHAVVFHADGHVGGDLIEGVGNRMEAGDPVVVVLYRGEGELGYELRVGGVDAAHLVDGHLPLFELGGFLVFGELAQEQIAADFFLVGESIGIYGGEAHEEGLFAGEAVVEGLHGVVGDLVVEALVAEGRGELGGMGEVIFPVVLKNLIEGLAIGFNGGCGGLRVQGGGADKQQERGYGQERETQTSQRSWTSG